MKPLTPTFDAETEKSVLSEQSEEKHSSLFTLHSSLVKRVLITDDAHPLLAEGLIERGWEVDEQPQIADKQVREIIGQYGGLVVNSKINVDKEMLDLGRDLKFVMRLGSGLEIIDLEYAREKQVAIISSPEGNCDSVAEHALGMLLALANNLCRSDAEVRQKIWQREKNRGFELMGKTVGIWGFGHTGSAFAKRLSGFGVQVLAYDKYKPAGYAAHLPYVKETGPEEIFEKAEILSFHLPLTPETKHLAGKSFFENFFRPIVLVNTSRGNVVDTEALIEALQNGKVSGACMDVFENEKPMTFSEAENRLYEALYLQENVVLSPHIAGWTHESKRRLSEVLLQKMDVFSRRNWAS